MAGQFRAFWLTGDAWADFRLDVMAPDADPGSEPLYSLTLHSLVLAAASPGHFKGHCERQREDGAVPLPTKRTVGVKRSAQEMATTDETHGDARAEVQMDSQPAAPSFDYRLTLFPGEPEGVPKTVLCHLYTGVVPDEPEQLIWMLRRADYLDLHDTVQAALQRLLLLGGSQLTLQHAGLILSLPAFRCDMRPTGAAAEQPLAAVAGPSPNAAAAAGQSPAAAAVSGQAGDAVASHAAVGQVAAGQRAAATAGPAAPPAAAGAASQSLTAKLQELLDSLLLTHLPSATAVAKDTALLAQFTQLPLALVKRWVELDKFQLDSGNTLVVLFAAWHDAQPEPPAPEQCRQLSALVPLCAVSFCFHQQVLQRLRWWDRPFGIRNLDSATAHYLALTNDSSSHSKLWREKAGSEAAQRRAIQTRTHIWDVGHAALARQWRDKELVLPYYAGYRLGARLTLKHDEADTERSGPLFLGLYKTMAWSEALLQSPHTSAVLPTTMGDRMTAQISVSLLGVSAYLKARIWQDSGGWSSVSGGFQYTSLEAFVPDEHAVLSVQCTMSLQLQ